MADKSNKVTLKITTLEQQLDNKQKRIDELNKQRQQSYQKQYSKKQNTPNLADDLFFDLFSLFKLG